MWRPARLLVEQAARELDYVANRAARDLSLARTATVALLVHHAQYPAHGEGTFSSRVVEGVSRALRRAGYDLLYVPVDDEVVGRVAGPGRGPARPLRWRPRPGPRRSRAPRWPRS